MKYKYKVGAGSSILWNVNDTVSLMGVIELHFPLI